jgi:translation initiation factor IF-1
MLCRGLVARKGVSFLSEGLQQPGEVKAEVVAHREGSRFLVRLEDGREVVATASQRVAREMFRIVPGDRVRVRGADGARPRITGFARSGHGE